MQSVVLAQKKPRPVEAVRWNGLNSQEILQFCSQAKINETGDLVVSSLENDRVVKLNDYVIKGANGEFYASGGESFHQNYSVGESIDDITPTIFMSKPKFVHTIRFHSEQFEDGVAFVKECNLTGVNLEYDEASGVYKITHPTREAYTIDDGDDIVFDFKRLYPCKHDIFESTYDTIGSEVANEGCSDVTRIFHSGEENPVTNFNLYDGYYLEDEKHNIQTIKTTNGFNGGIGIISLLRIARDMLYQCGMFYIYPNPMNPLDLQDKVSEYPEMEAALKYVDNAIRDLSRTFVTQKS